MPWLVDEQVVSPRHLRQRIDVGDVCLGPGPRGVTFEYGDTWQLVDVRRRAVFAWGVASRWTELVLQRRTWVDGP